MAIKITVNNIKLKTTPRRIMIIKEGEYTKIIPGLQETNTQHFE